MRWALQWLAGWLFALWAIREALVERLPPPPLPTDPVPQRVEPKARPAAPLALPPAPPTDLSRVPALLRTATEPPVGCGVPDLPAPMPDVREIAPDVYETTAWPVQGSTRIVPAFRNGRAIGFKVFAVPPGTGLKGGDVILRVNGLTLASPDSALEAWSKLKAASRFEIDLERDGRLLKKTYVLRPRREAPSSRPSTSPGDH